MIKHCSKRPQVPRIATPHTRTVTSRKKQVTISYETETAVLNLGEHEIWDGADLAVLREALSQLMLDEGILSVTLEMQYVKALPSGFFGMLHEWLEKVEGSSIFLDDPQPQIQNMLWFQEFTLPLPASRYELAAVSPQPMGLEERLALD